MINGSCIQISCEVQGQQSINGICQCTNINAYVQGDTCVCPLYSTVVGNTCLCNTISGQVMIKGQCVCPTNGAIIRNGSCSCGQNSLNISNTCSCPTGSTLQAGVCTCTSLNSYIQGSTCVCPQYSSLIGNVCTCPQYSQLNGNICTCNLASGFIMNAGVCKCATSGAFIINNTCTCGINSLNTSNTCSCPVNSSLIGGNCTCTIIGQTMQNSVCLCPLGQTLIGGTCKETIYQIDSTDNFLKCNQGTYITSFDISIITNSINSGNFSNGFVFSSNISITNAFINIISGVYTVVNPLFQSQSVFSNIKIQIETQSVSCGSILTQSSVVTIYQMNIISKDNNLITVSSDSQLNIFTQFTTQVTVNNLLINLSISVSSGDISLINNIRGLLNVSGYHVLGKYQSTATVAMIGIYVNQATVNLIQVNFQPYVYKIGNQSSYIFSQINNSSLSLTNIAIILGNSTINQITTQISSSTNFIFQYGGIACNSNISTIAINNYLSDCYLNINTGYVSDSGILVGNISVNSSITIQNVCMQQNIISTQLNSFGLVGQNFGNIQLNQLALQLSIQANVSYFGLVGYQLDDSDISNIIISVNTTGTTCVAGVFGYLEETTSSIQNISVIHSNIICTKIYVGSLIGNLNSSAYIFNSSVSLTKISGSSFVAGFIGRSFYNTSISNSSIQLTYIFCSNNFVGGFIGVVSSDILLQNSKIVLSNLTVTNQYCGGLLGTTFDSLVKIQNSSVQQVRLFGSHTGIVCYNDQAITNFVVTNSFSSGNYINNILQNNCASLSNNWSVLQCA
ncbi:Conserved_hypothetical protein [Hexamita inflata]|uniref:Uncharacterized protein n=1 Tax=Hexamita inflata TaxID=28002 RepID=A0AA86PP79_9EUKA|nr:Conserved hypothetical protein [Hexamita inflata]